MTYKNLDEPVEQYKDGASLEAVAADAGVAVDELTAELRSRGVQLRNENQTAVTSTRY